jgi:16S rRNA (uracil1498-N3)-methyltransferase
MEQTVIAACKQSGRNWLMAIEEMMTLEAALQQIPESEQLLAAHPGGSSLAERLWTPEPACTLVIGPEGGFTHGEYSLIKSANACVFSLGETILRTETAAIACASWFRLMAGS